MNSVDRRSFLKVAGVSTMVVGIGLPVTKILAARATGSTYSFRGLASLPRPPLPAFASYVLEGRLDIERRTGALVQNVFAGAADLMSDIALPGHARTFRVTDIRKIDDVVYVRGIGDDQSQLDTSESPIVEVRLEPSRGMAITQFMGSDLELKLNAS
jgi:hypothetical protein